MSLYGGVEEDNNIVNQMWLCLLLHSKPWHLPSLVNTEGGFFEKPFCHKHSLQESLSTLHTVSVCTVHAESVMHLFKWLL